MASVVLYVDVNSEKALGKVQQLSRDLTKALERGDDALAKHIQQHINAETAVIRQSNAVKKLQTDYESFLATISSGESGALLGVQTAIDTTKQRLSELQAQISQGKANGEDVSSLTEQYNIQQAELVKLEEQYKQLQQSIYEAQSPEVQAEIQATTNKIAEQEMKLTALQTKAQMVGASYSMSSGEAEEGVRSVEQATEELGDSTARNTKRASTHLTSLGDKLKNIGNMISRIMKRIVIFATLGVLLRTVIKEMGAMLMSNEQFAQSIEQLKASLYMLAVPIYESVLPALTTLIQFLAKVVTAVAVFIYAIQGKSYTQLVKNAKALRKQTAAYKNSTKATKDNANAQKDLNKQLAAFDELLILQDEKQKNLATAGGAGGGASMPDIEETDLSWAEGAEKWIKEHKNALLLAGALGAVGLAIANLLPLFKRKDKGLDTQTGKTGAETSAVGEMVKAFGKALVPVGALATAFGLLTGQEKQNETQLGKVRVATETVTDRQTELETQLGLTQSATQTLTEVQQANEEQMGYNARMAHELGIEYQNTQEPIQKATEKTQGYTTSVQDATSAVEQHKQTVDTKIPEATQTIETETGNAQSAFDTFHSETKKGVYNWGTNISKNTEITAQNISDNTKKGLQNAADNIDEFATKTTSPMKSWADNMIDFMRTVLTGLSKLASGYSKLHSIAEKFTLGHKITEAINDHISGTNSGKGVVGAGLTLVGAAIAATALLPFGLANGGVVPPNKKFLAMLGDNTREPEVVSPLSTMKQAVQEAVLELGGSFGSGNTTVVLEVDGREFGRAVVEQGNRETRRIGTKLVVV